VVTCTLGEQGEVIPGELRHLQADADDALGPYRARELVAAMAALGVADHRLLADGQWRDFVLGLLTDGECWVDELSVIQSPTNNPVQLISNGNFENGLTGWRILGNHQRSVLETDPDAPGNHVLHVIASGPQEHMNNHIETTLAGGHCVTNGLLYEVSYRARWISGNNLLNTRLYFNRVARTVALPVPQLNGTPGAGRDLYAEAGGGIEVDEACGAGAEEDDVLQPRAKTERGLVEIGRVVDHGVVPGDGLWNVACGDGPHVDRNRNVVGPMNLPPHAIDVRRRIDEKRLGHRRRHALKEAIAFSSNFRPRPGLVGSTSWPFSIAGVSS
jgi:hypothetical protein